MDDSLSYGLLATALTLLGAGATWWAFRRRGPRTGTRVLAVTLLPFAAYLTGTLRLVDRVVSAVGSWAAGFAFGPLVWVGLALAGVAVVLFVVGGRLPAGGPRRPAGEAPARSATRGEVPAAGDRTASRPAAADDDLAEIEDILRNRGIS